MRRSAGRLVWAALLFLVMAGNIGIILANWQNAGTWPSHGTDVRLDATHFRLMSVDATGRRAGFQPGDVIDLQTASFATRVAYWEAAPEAGTRIGVPIERNGVRRELALVSAPLPEATKRDAIPWLLLAVVAAAASLLVALFGRGAAALAAALMFAFVSLYATSFSDVRPFIEPAWISAFTTVARPASGALFAVTAAVVGILLLPRGDAARRIPLWGAWGAIAVTVLAIWPLDYAIFLARGVSVFAGTFLYPYATLAAIVLTLVVFAVAAHEAPPERRLATQSLFFVTTIGLGIEAIAYVAVLLRVEWPLVDALRPIAWLVLLAGYVYAFVARRLLPIEFVLKRAALATVMTLAIAGIFAAVQWSISTVLVRAAHAHTFAVQLTAAVAAFYLVRGARLRIEGFVLGHLFRPLQRRLEAIAEIGHEAESLTDPDAVAPFVVRELATHGIAASIYIPTDTIPVDSRPGFLVIPMRVRGRLRGVLACRFPEADELFDPDEVRALESLARQIAIVREDLFAEDLQRRLAAAQSEIVALKTGVSQVTPSVVEGQRQ